MMVRTTKSTAIPGSKHSGRGERGADADLCLYVDATVVIVHDTVYYSQSQATAAFSGFAHIEVIEQEWQLLLGNAHTLVRHRDRHAVLVPRGRDGDAPPEAGVLDRVAEQVHQRLDQRDLVPVDRAHRLVDRGHDVDLLAGGVRLHALDRLPRRAGRRWPGRRCRYAPARCRPPPG